MSAIARQPDSIPRTTACPGPGALMRSAYSPGSSALALLCSGFPSSDRCGERRAVGWLAWALGGNARRTSGHSFAVTVTSRKTNRDTQAVTTLPDTERHERRGGSPEMTDFTARTDRALVRAGANSTRYVLLR